MSQKPRDFACPLNLGNVKTFIDPIVLDETQARFVSFIIDMAHSLHLQVVAESVEEFEQGAKLKSIGCDIIQGCFYSRPVPEEEAFALLQGQ